MGGEEQKRERERGAGGNRGEADGSSEGQEREYSKIHCVYNNIYIASGEHVWG